jgi:hypothetical protein
MDCDNQKNETKRYNTNRLEGRDPPFLDEEEEEEDDTEITVDPLGDNNLQSTS